MKTILCISPHSDDAELGMGGTISKMVEEGHLVINLIFSFCDNPALPMEASQSATKLGHKLEICSFKVRRFNESRQEILDNMIRVKQMLNPDMVFIPCSDDVHQDHQIIINEAKRAFKGITIMGYELPWNCRNFEATAFSELTVDQVKKKYSAIACYKSQVLRKYTDETFTMSQAIFRGVQSGFEFAEAFEVIRLNF